MIQRAKAAAAVRQLRKHGMVPVAIYSGSEDPVEGDHFNVVPMPVRKHLSIGVRPVTLSEACRAAALLGDRCDGTIYIGSGWHGSAKYVEFPVTGTEVFAPLIKGVTQLRVVRVPYVDHFSIGLK